MDMPSSPVLDFIQSQAAPGCAYMNDSPKQSEPNSKQATTSNIFKWQLCSPVAAPHSIPFAAGHSSCSKKHQELRFKKRS
jgi:hypothetical protein